MLLRISRPLRTLPLRSLPPRSLFSSQSPRPSVQPLGLSADKIETYASFFPGVSRPTQAADESVADDGRSWASDAHPQDLVESIILKKRNLSGGKRYMNAELQAFSTSIHRYASSPSSYDSPGSRHPTKFSNELLSFLPAFPKASRSEFNRGTREMAKSGQKVDLDAFMVAVKAFEKTPTVRERRPRQNFRVYKTPGPF